MKISIRLVVSLIITVAAVVVSFSFYSVIREKERLVNDLERRTVVLAESLKETSAPLVKANSAARLNRLVKIFGDRERLKGVAVFDARGGVISVTPSLAPAVSNQIPVVVDSLTDKTPSGELMRIDGKKVYVFSMPILSDDQPIGALALFQDASYIDARLAEIWRYNLIRFLALSVFIVAVTLIVVRWSVEGPIALVARWIRDVRTGKGKPHYPAGIPKGTMLEPLISEVTFMAKSLAMARARAEEEARLRFRAESLWTAQRLKEYMLRELGGKKLFLVSNREPYMHTREGRAVKAIMPAGGLVTALDPVMRICDGVWIASGSGEADRETVDADDKLRVPPEEPAYTLKRVWLTKEEEDGYYYGFSNEGIWPLCHITHTRPTFRLEDWVKYQEVNEKFAEAVLKEIESEESPLVLIQDYHLALLPYLIKQKRPDAKVAIFWHIPWPNPEAYGICPWRQEILLGMLGADLIGFHIQIHCNNFLDTVDRFLESKIDWEQFMVVRGGHATLVRPYPISVAFENQRESAPRQDRREIRENIFKEMGFQAEFLGVGVDRIDYTKGIPERFRAIERFFEKYPQFIEKFTFVELGAPSRTHIKRYHDLISEVEELADRINWRFQAGSWKPIVFLKAQHSHRTIERFYMASDVCIVSSLHDGMNLVAKEFVAARDDGDGVLVLSQFAGASRELVDALIINPYDVEATADATYSALAMDRNDRADRMRRMRAVIRENNIYRWAGNLVTDLGRLRLSDNV